VELVLVAGGGAAAIAFLLGLAFARSVRSLLLLAAAGAFIVMAYHAAAAPGELMHAAANANLLSWLAGTLLAARLRALEWLDRLDAQEAT
jgi:hypothetical protein